MQFRCHEHKKLGLASLANYRWIITKRGFASVLESPGDFVEGVAFELSSGDEAILDECEGPNYYKKTVKVILGKKEVEALIYIDKEIEEGHPKDEYMNRINHALTDAGLSEQYISCTIRKYVPAT